MATRQLTLTAVQLTTSQFNRIFFTQCICCGKHIHNDTSLDTSNKYISPNCLKQHGYCTTCALSIINESLSLYNQPPKCIIPTCNQPFNISSSKPINSKLFLEYDMNIKQYNYDKFLLSAYIRQHKNNLDLFPVDIIELIHAFYKLIVIAQTVCTRCNNSKTQVTQCNNCDSNGYVYYTSFNKVIATQKRCQLCHQYYSSSKIFHWNECNHEYCNECMLVDFTYIEEKIRFDRIPKCSVPDCKKELTKESLKLIYLFLGSYNSNVSDVKDIMKVYYETKLDMMHKSKTYFECGLCNCWHKKEDMFVLSNCGCVCTKYCVQKLIENVTRFCMCKCGWPIDVNDMVLCECWESYEYYFANNNDDAYYGNNNLCYQGRVAYNVTDRNIQFGFQTEYR